MAAATGWFEHITQGPAHKWWALAVVLLGLLLSSIDSSIVNLALPTIAREYGIGVQVVEWVAVAYFTMVTVVLLTAGRLADRLGRKRVFVVGFGLFTLASALCAAAPSVELLIAFRLLQALGAACLLANGNAITGAVFPTEERGRAVGFNASVIALGSVAGLALGGFLVDAFGWRSIFLINVPIGIVAVALAALVLREDRLILPGEHTRSFDGRGALLSIVALGGLLLAFERSASDGSIDFFDLILLAVVLVALLLLIRYERQRPEPLIDLGLLRRPAFAFGLTATAISSLALGTVNFVMPFYVENVLGDSPRVAGMLLTPYSLLLGFAGPFAGWLSDRMGPRWPAAIGLACSAAALLALSSIGADSSYVILAGGLLLMGLGTGLFSAPNNHAVLSAAPHAELGMASSLLGAMRFMGRAAGTSLSATLIEAGLMGTGGAIHTSEGLELTRHPERLPAYLGAQALDLQIVAALLVLGVFLCLARGRSEPAPARAAA